ncbi:MAG: hypothetical protein M3021_13165, partial [Actinomycetota bacterium]|nr:hypothetical protein [Actinomycetota bacterium]
MRITIQIDTASGEATVDTEPSPGGTAQPPAAGVPAIDAGAAPAEVGTASSAAPDTGRDGGATVAGQSAGPAPSLA